MKDQHGKPDTCDECIHYTHLNQMCEQTKASPYDYETCPVPEKIEASKKDPMEECVENIYCAVNGGSTLDQIRGIVKTYWPKDKPKGDIDKAWSSFSSGMIVNSIGFVEEEKRFKKALKEAGF